MDLEFIEKTLASLKRAFEAGRKSLSIKLMHMDAQDSVCSHCGYYCTGKSVFCNPPINPRQ